MKNAKATNPTESRPAPTARIANKRSSTPHVLARSRRPLRIVWYIFWGYRGQLPRNFFTSMCA